ncbi:hypothetical protein CRE_16350 [Caenorhabditis remanei]|uniref:SCP domain-containing protein n=1 Tax=Caenorhabditis remanei TaxID=31234 RepID=E3NC80_CAERE|nr:hypothetical protein CRE_16350 [Caenorhabditis remanei]
MKVLLAATLLLLSAPSGNTDFIKHCLTEEEYKTWSDPTIEGNKITDLNNERAHIATIYQIANMHELKYDMALEKEARKMRSCDDLKHGVNYRKSGYGSDESDEIWVAYVRNGSDTPYTIWAYEEDKHPLQTSFIECELTADCYKGSVIVLYGWRGTLSLSDFQRGPPGSKCTHGKTEEGLCIAPPKTEAKTTAPPKSKIETTAPSRSDSEAIGSSSENNDEGVNSILVYLSIALMSLFL